MSTDENVSDSVKLAALKDAVDLRACRRATPPKSKLHNRLGKRCFPVLPTSAAKRAARAVGCSFART